MGFGGGGSSAPQTVVYQPAPTAPPAPTPAPTAAPVANPPVLANATTAQASTAARAASAGAVGGLQGFDGTIATSPLGAPAGPTVSKSLLGT